MQVTTRDVLPLPHDTEHEDHSLATGVYFGLSFEIVPLRVWVYKDNRKYLTIVLILLVITLKQ